MSTNNVSPNQRRNFLWVMVAGLASLLGVATAWPIFRFLSPTGGDDSSATVELARGQVPVGGAHFFQYRGRPAVILQPAQGNFVAFSAVCTHLGCVVAWQDDAAEFLCPCHGGRFASDGTVISGPPPKPLESLQVALNGDQIQVG
ncbi:MAG: ubiquinol-cytochrome c reductase iron-sulfur subunit [Deltaproteobacteria bacterium]|jgi:cytochrome b6-f complex iron-sulfur subunit|nr:ubiquinol-cytochrome c reductase iron-sulfur subunit [Deltaproteobacteria bacterium]